MSGIQENTVLDVEGTVLAQGNENKTLPSMPLLLPGSRPSSPLSSTSKTECDFDNEPLSTPSENEQEMSSPEKLHTLSSPGKESSNDVDAPIEECDEHSRGNSMSSGDKRKPATFPSNGHPPPKKRRKQETLDLMDGMEEEPGTYYAEAYFSKVKSMLDDSTFQNFIAILSEAKDEPGGAVALYKKIEELFVDFPELAEDFVGTLRPDQALEIGKLLELKFITRSLAFFKKLEGFQLTKVIHALESLVSNTNLTEELVKSTILSILKGHAPLAESFLHLLPNEKPPPPSSLDDYEDITEAMLEEGEDGGWETVRIPEHTERGCLSECPCRCHATPSQPFCLACNIRFIKGQAYVQYGKVIRYCKVHFGDMSHDEVLQRFNPALYSKRRRKRKSINKTPLPPNETSKEVNEVMFQDENAVISTEDVQLSSSPGHVEDKAEEEDDYWEEDDVSSGDKSSGGDLYEEMDRHSEDTEDRLIGQLNNPLSPLASTVEGVNTSSYLQSLANSERSRCYSKAPKLFSRSDEHSELAKLHFYVKNGLPSEGTGDAVRGVVIDVSDIQPNGVNAHVFKFETRVSDDPCIQAPSTLEDEKVERKEGNTAVVVDETKTATEVPVLTKAAVVVDSEIPPNSQGSRFPETSSAALVTSSKEDTEVLAVKTESPESLSCENAPESSASEPVDGVKTETDSEASDEAKSDKEWTRQEDKMILEAFQREIGTEETLARIRNLMPARSVDQIRERFQVLMNLLEKVASSHDSQPRTG